MNFFEKLTSLTNEQEQTTFALSHACDVYGLNKENIIVPEQGIQTFTFVAGDKVVRIARMEGVSQIMGDEVSVLKGLEGKTDYKTPHVLDHRYEQHMMSVSCLPGKSLSYEEFAALDQALQDNLAEQMGRFLGQMHKAFPQKSTIEVPWREDVLQIIRNAMQKETDASQQSRLQSALQYVQDYGKSDSPYVMLHGDLHPGNTLYDSETGKLGFIDFTSAKYGSAHRDFVKIRRKMPWRAYDIAVKAYEKETGLEIDREKVDIATDIFNTVYDKAPQPLPAPSTAVRPNGHPSVLKIAQAQKARR
jgi:aminoglycoside phosphotransferase